MPYLCGLWRFANAYYKTVKEEEPKNAVPPLLFFKTSITLRAKIKQGKLIGFRHIAKQSQITHQFYGCL